MAQRQGVGKVRQIDIKYLWIQDVVRERRPEIHKIVGGVNPADVGTKYLMDHEMAKVLAGGCGHLGQVRS